MATIPTTNTSFLTGKAGPLPVWLWAAIGLLLAIGFSIFRNKKNAATTANADPSAAAGTNEVSQVPDFISQTYITNQPPGVTVTTGAGTPSTPSGPSTPPVNTPVPKLPPPVTGKPVTAPPKPVNKAPLAYKVKKGDTLTSIAAAHGFGKDWQSIWNYNLTPGVRPASTIATLKQRGPNTLFSGETIYIPVK